MALFEKIATMKRRTAVKFCSYTLALILLLVGTTIVGFKTAVEYRIKFENDYQRGLAGLSEHLNNIETALIKSTYAGTSKGLNESAVTLWSEAGAAKVCLSELPSSESQLDKTYKFLSQIGDYSVYLSQKLSGGGEITADERKSLSALAKYASSVSSDIGEIQAKASGSGMMSTVMSVIKNSDIDEDGGFSDTLKTVEDSFTDYPTLLYDGPFADNILNAKPVFLIGKEPVSRDAALNKAAEISGNEDVRYSSVLSGTIPCYVFEAADLAVTVTQQGGYCNYMLSSREVGEQKIQYDEAVEIAREYLEKLDMGKFKESYYVVNEGVCVINFACMSGDTVLYSDLVKVGVALDNGDIYSVNTTGYLMNHTERSLKKPARTKTAAQAVLSPLLEVKSSEIAIIPLNTRKEVLCYEFLCKGQNNQEILVYINSETLQEEEILIVLKTDGGTLTI